ARQKPEQRARPLRKTKTIEHFIFRRASTADHVPDMNLCELVVAEIDHSVVLTRQRIDQSRALVRTLIDVHADEDHRVVRIAVSIVEFGDRTVFEIFTERAKTSWTFGNSDREDRFLAFAEIGPLRHVAQAIEV